MKWPATIANCLWLGGSLPAWSSFRRALNCPGEVQRHLLRELLARNAQSSYGRAHDFGSITSYEDFTRRVPLVDYEELEPWVERIRLGEQGVLTIDRVTHLIPTSGTSQARKLIPFTAELQKQFDRAISPWIVDLARQHPKILRGPAYWSITPPNKPAEPGKSAVPIGFNDDADYLGGVKRRLVRAAMVSPDDLNTAADLEEFRCQTLVCLLRERDLRLISVWHPTFLTHLLDAMPGHWDRILTRLRREGSHRVRELEQADPGQPETLWPHLQVISCWGDSHARFSLADLRGRFPRTSVQSKGLLATEAFVSIPFAGRHPLAVCSHFFEFIDENGKIHIADEVCDGRAYEVVVTTAGGLWRYRLRDRIEVTGFLGRTPSLRFIGRSGNCSDLFGEKLSEAFVSRVIQESSSGGVRFAMLAPDQDSDGLHYTLYVEGPVSPGLATALEHALRENPNYAHCRDLGQLEAVRIFRVTGRGYATFADRLVSEGRRLGDIKPIALSRSAGWNFCGAYVEDLPSSGAAKGHQMVSATDLMVASADDQGDRTR